MLRYDTIATEEDNIKLIKQTYEDGNSDVWIEMKKHWTKKKLVIWDNNRFIFETFLPFLNRWLDRKLLSTDLKEFDDIWKWLDENWVKDAKEILEEALKLKWYENDNSK